MPPRPQRSPVQADLIDGVRLKRLVVHCDERGRLMEMIRADDHNLNELKFGQAYLTTAYPGVTKAWHYHLRQTDHFVCVKGMMKVALYDARSVSPTHGRINELFVGEHNPMLIEIPPLVYHGFKCIGDTEALIVNFASELYDPAHPDEMRLDPNSPEIPYDWSRRDG